MPAGRWATEQKNPEIWALNALGKQTRPLIRIHKSISRDSFIEEFNFVDSPSVHGLQIFKKLILI